MFFKRIETESLSQYSYLIGDKDELVVIDPQLDVDRYQNIARENGMKIKKIFETHRNEDFIVGSLALSKLTGAMVYTSGHDDLVYEYGEKVYDQDEFIIGGLKIKTLHTPGHTKGHLSFLVSLKDNPYLIFTGDTLFYGDVGRIDFYGAENLGEMGRSLYESIFHKVFHLGDHIILCPAHGAGSACGENIEERPYTTIGYERQFNSKLKTKDVAEFIKLNGKMHFKPPYFTYMEKMNLIGAPPLECYPKLEIKYPQDLEEGKAYLVDIRSQDAFNNAHIKNSIFLPKNEIVGFINWVVDREADICFISDQREEDLRKIYVDLRRIGYTGELSFLAKGMLPWHKEGRDRANLKTITAKEFNKIKEEVFILDVRKKSEIRGNDLRANLMIPIEEIKSKYQEIPQDKEIVVLCPSGIRSNIAASFLKTKGIGSTVLLGGISSLKSLKNN